MATERIPWEQADFVSSDGGGLAADLHGVSVTLLSRDDDFLLAWSLKIGGNGATLPMAEEVLLAGAARLKELLDEDYEVEWRPEDG